MAKTGATLFQSGHTASRRVLFLSKFLYSPDPQENIAHITFTHNDGPDLRSAHDILKKWAKMETDGLLKKKETALDANFLHDVFGTALRYTSVQNAAKDGSFTLDRQLAVPGVGPVDGALGIFPFKDPKAPTPVAVIELKGADTDLDTDKSNGRTAVQQLFDYLNGLPETHWGIVSNFSTIRLYNKSRGSQTYESFSLQKLAADLDHFKAFWCLFEKGGLLPSILRKIPRADELLTKTGERQKEVGDELYNYYADYRSELISTLQKDFNKSLDEAIRIAQKIFDRIIFVAFCEDRGLIKQKSIKSAIQNVPPFHKVKNPRWKNFVGLFHGIDKGHPDLGINHGYNGGLFAEDPAIDDLELPDLPWTTVFENMAEYDYKDEVNVDVLGHIFERSITELEKRRVAGVFGPATAPDAKKPKMQKSAERKRFGIYYTPPEFTRFIVNETIGQLLRDRFADLEKAHGVTPRELAADYSDRSPRLEAYYLQCLHVLRNFKAVDPACGSGAFLIAAYELFEDFYFDVTKHLRALGHPDADKIMDQIPDFILKDNLYGVDLSEEAVEITRLALWIRSARTGRTLADLTHNVVCGNSLVDDIKVHPRAMNWKTTFPNIFNSEISNTKSEIRNTSGFDAVIGNPPWERIKLQEREFFAFASPEIASAVSAATRRKLIEKLEKSDPELNKRYLDKQSEAENISKHVRASGHFPLTARGDINTYMLFAELARSLVSPAGRVGLLVPSGIATDNTTKDFFANLIDSQALIKLYDFENRLGVFPDVDGRFKFCTLIVGGSEIKTPNADFVFFAHTMKDLEEKKRHIALSKKDIALLNPNTRTCPIFRSRHDAELTIQIYRRVRVLIDDKRKQERNPWSVEFNRVFDQDGASELFASGTDLEAKGFKLRGNVFQKGSLSYLPLYEAKMAQAYDHRCASVRIEAANWQRLAQTVESSKVEHEDSEFSPIPTYWVLEHEVAKRMGEAEPAYLAFKKITSSTNRRTMIAAMLPFAAFIDSFPICIFSPNISWNLRLCLLANFNSHAYDYIARQKVGGNHLNFFIVEQLPTLPPDTYADKCPWSKKQTLEKWISERVLKLSCTANDMIPLAKACNFNPKGDKSAGGIPYVWKWKESERKDLRAQLDAAYFLLYGITDRDDVIYILSTFQASGVEKNPPHNIEPGSDAELILAYYDDYKKN